MHRYSFQSKISVHNGHIWRLRFIGDSVAGRTGKPAQPELKMGIKIPAEMRRRWITAATSYETSATPPMKQYDTVIVDANATGRNLFAPCANQAGFSMLRIGEAFVKSVILLHKHTTKIIICYDNPEFLPPIRAAVLHTSRYGKTLDTAPDGMDPTTHLFAEGRVWRHADAPATPDEVESCSLVSSNTTINKMLSSREGKPRLMRLHAESVKRALETSLANGAISRGATVVIVPPTGENAWVVTEGSHACEPRRTMYGEADMLIMAYAEDELRDGALFVHSLCPRWARPYRVGV